MLQLKFRIEGSRCANLLTMRSKEKSQKFSPKGSQEISELGADDGVELLKFWAPNITDKKTLNKLANYVDGLTFGIRINRQIAWAGFSRQTGKSNTANN